jgi:ABC-type transport system involved in cytochrome c biogenesis permease subunit
MLFDLHVAALLLYVLSAVVTLAPFAGLPAVSRRWTLAIASLGAVLHGIGVAQLIVMGISGLARPLSVLAWFLVVLQIWSELLLRVGTVALFTAPLASGLVGLALMLGLAPGAQPSAGRNAWFILHVALSVLGLALLALAFISAALYVLQFRELKAKRFGQVFQRFPPLERLDRLNLVALVAGFPALTIGVLLAVGYAVRYAGGMHVDPAQLVWGSFTWVVLGWTVWVRVVRHWAGRRAAFASIAGFAAVVLVYIALKLAQPGTQRFL